MAAARKRKVKPTPPKGLDEPLPTAEEIAVRQPVVPLQTAVTRVSVNELRAILEDHEVGIFWRAGLLAEHLKRIADVAGALEQRIGGVLGLPFEFEPADRSTNASSLASRVQARWGRVFPSGAQRVLLQDRILLGFAFARIDGYYDAALDEVVPYVERWHPSLIQYRPWERVWYALTNAEGYIPVADYTGAVADGWIASFAGERTQAHFEGALRSLGEPFLSSQYAQRDARRHSERLGQGILEAQVPGLQAETEEAKRFVKALARVGATGVMVSPQYGDEHNAVGVSYGLKLHFPPPEGLGGLLELDKAEASRVRRRILGQDTTTVDSTGGGYARAKVGDEIRQDLIELDACALQDVTHALFDAWAAFEDRPRRLFPIAQWQAEPPEDTGLVAQARQQNAAALSAVVTSLPALLAQAEAAGLTVDVHALLEQYGVPLQEIPDDGPDP